MKELLTIINPEEKNDSCVETSDGYYLLRMQYLDEQLESFRNEASNFYLEARHDFDYESSSDAGMGIEQSYSSYSTIEINDDMYLINNNKLAGFIYENNVYLFDGLDSHQKLNVDYAGQNYHHYDATTVSIKQKANN